jgi:hypothetical protein
MERFETRAFSLLTGAAWVTMLMVYSFLGWEFYRSGYLGGIFELPMLPLTVLAVLFAVLCSLATFPKIVIDRDGVVVNKTFLSLYFTVDEVKVRAGGYVLQLGGWLTRDYFVPFKWRQCVEAVVKIMGLHVPKEPRRTPLTFLLYLLALLALFPIEHVMGNFGFTLSPLPRAIMWGAAVFFFMTLFVYKSPARVKVWKLNKAGSSIIFGIWVGVTAFLIMLLPAIVRGV